MCPTVLVCRFRQIHHVSDEEHDAILSRVGWSSQQYAQGVNHVQVREHARS